MSRLRRYLRVAPLQGILQPHVAARVQAKLEPLSEPARVALGEAVALYAFYNVMKCPDLESLANVVDEQNQPAAPHDAMLRSTSLASHVLLLSSAVERMRSARTSPDARAD